MYSIYLKSVNSILSVLVVSELVTDFGDISNSRLRICDVSTDQVLVYSEHVDMSSPSYVDETKL